MPAKLQVSGANNSIKFFAAISLLWAAACTTSAEQLPHGMVEIPKGVFTPLYTSSSAERTAEVDETELVERFFIDERAVTNADYLEFVGRYPKWQRSRIPGLFADDSYLTDWRGDLDFGDTAKSAFPVVNVSWFAAVAYCRAQGKQLPTVAQWERAAAASETLENARDDANFSARILDWYTSPADRPLTEQAMGEGYRNLYGAWNMHGLIWEWTRDFNTAMVTGESRGDAGLQRQLFCGSGSIGAADPRDYASFMRFAFRSSLAGDYTVGSLGFRCSFEPAN